MKVFNLILDKTEDQQGIAFRYLKPSELKVIEWISNFLKKPSKAIVYSCRNIVKTDKYIWWFIQRRAIFNICKMTICTDYSVDDVNCDQFVTSSRNVSNNLQIFIIKIF